jgi:hypothetical protein
MIQSPFYKPLAFSLKDTSFIVYPMTGVEELIDRSKTWLIEDHMKRLCEKYPALWDCSFHLVILWRDKNLMTDVWSFLQLESQESGFTIDCKTFRNLKEERGEGITASDGVIMLGREVELEEAIRKNGGDLKKDYILGKRPELPGELNPTEKFYI